MSINRIKALATLSLILPVLALAVFDRTNPAVAAVEPAMGDVAATYKTKCAMCHTAKAEKSYDPAMADEQQVEAILKGKKAEKPPHMPAFEPKGMTADEAKELVAYMKELRKPAQ